ncbi:hypothetical protein AYK25_00825 [Thermoplasmatales archaeon SM1-50]|nr:MAG: hypothetical protein AYK25_00825 [Thermoplasmatales archaeon SM1-50]
MNFRVCIRDGPARIGHLTLDTNTIVTPNIFFLHTTRYNAPAFSDILLTNKRIQTKKPYIQIGESLFSSTKTQKNHCLHHYLLYAKDVPADLHLSASLQKKHPEITIIPAKKELIPKLTKNNDTKLFIVAYATQLFMQQTDFVDFITKLREQIGYQKLIYLPCVGDPTSIAFLTYLGVDFFDSFSACMAARNETFLFPNGLFRKNNLPELPCSCPSCFSSNDATVMNYKEILQHNYFTLNHEIKQVRNAIATGSLRELVETRVRSSPHLASLLRILDLRYYRYLEERTPVVRKQPLIATTKDALARPEIRRFQERVLHRFEKPESTKILLLLPCSAKKPYSFSKSHTLFRECLQRITNPFVVHEVIITSPLGLVPRELELTYPASRYDIAVTGYWDDDEKKMIRSILQEYVQRNHYDATIVHLPVAMQDFLCDWIKDPYVTCKDSPTSTESLAILSKELEEMTQCYPRIQPQQRYQENIKSLACYQLGFTLATLLMDDCTITGKYPYQKIMHKTTQLGMLTEERGFLSLTMAGAQRLLDAKQYWVEIYDDFTLKGSVFAPGIQQADASIRIGDEVLVEKANQLCGVGVALMNGTEMSQATQGEAVKIRHHL